MAKGDNLGNNICHKNCVNFQTFVGKLKKSKAKQNETNKNNVSIGIGLSGPGFTSIRQRNAVIAF